MVQPADALKFAHTIKHHFDNWQNAISFAWNKKRLEARLYTNLCYFKYKKLSDGQERIALGTLNPQYYLYTPKKKKKKASKWYLIKYWDAEKSGWRCLDARNLLKIYW